MRRRTIALVVALTPALSPPTALALGVEEQSAPPPSSAPQPTFGAPASTEPPPASAPPSSPAPSPSSTLAPTTPPAGAGSHAFFRLALQTEGAVGISGPFYNHLGGLRFDRCFTTATCVGVFAGYANLKGPSGRAGNVLSYALLDHHASLGRGWYVPLRIATGYLPRNGPYARASAGIGGTAGGGVDLALEVVAPAVWVTGNEPVMSMDVAAEVAFRF